jgi:hypothetical protein
MTTLSDGSASHGSSLSSCETNAQTCTGSDSANEPSQQPSNTWVSQPPP